MILKKRIYRNFLALFLSCILLLSLSISIVFYDVVKKQEMVAIKDRALIISGLLNKSIMFKEYDESSEYYNSGYLDFINTEQYNTRVSIITPTGTIIFDNKFALEDLEDYANVEEIIQATTTGVGEVIQFSDTLGSVSFYYTIKLEDGNILRISKELNNIIDIFTSVWFMVFIITVFIIFISYIIARKITDNIVKPINNIDIDTETTDSYEELIPFFRKIEQQKREITKQLKDLENRANTIKVITDNMKEGLIFVDNDGIILSANTSVVKIFDESNMQNKNILQICRDTKFLQQMDICLSGESSEMSLERKGRIYNIYLNPVYERKKISGAIILFLDTTEKYKAEKQRREFSANVSHELKTPLTTISALAEMIGNGMAKGEDIVGFAIKISDRSNRLINIIDDIIKLSEFDEGGVDSDMSSFDLMELTHFIASSLQDKADEKDVEIKILGEHFFINANERMIDELIFNLLDNGIKYNKQGGKVEISLLNQGAFYIITVSDTGIGIPIEHHERVFERFYRVDKSRSQRIGGTGLGLSIVKHIVEYHNGTIELDSKPSIGTKIKCYIKASNNI